MENFPTGVGNLKTPVGKSPTGAEYFKMGVGKFPAGEGKLVLLAFGKSNLIYFSL